MSVVKKSIQEVTRALAEIGVSQVKQAKMFGVSALMIHNYQHGKTKSPGIKVVKAVYDNVFSEGKPVLIDTFNSYEDFKTAWEIHQKGQASDSI